MDRKTLSELSNEELIIEKKKLKKRKVTNALIIGFLTGIIAVGFMAWFLGSKKNFITFLLPMIFPIYFIYLIIKNSKKYKELEIVLKERKLS